ncbi:MAG: glycosyltransferase family 4 protein [Anaerolineae bacterium]
MPVLTPADKINGYVFPVPLMKIVFVGPFGLQPKGTMSVRALPLARALVGRGHTVSALIPPWDDPQRAGDTFIDGGVTVENLPLPGPVPLLFHILLTRRLAARALALRPDVVHLFKPKAYAGLAHLLLFWLRRLGGPAPRLVLDTDDWEQAWNDVLPYSAAQKRLFAWQERWGLAHADAVTAASRELVRLAETVRGPHGIHYLPNGCRSGPNQPPPASGQAVRSRYGVGDAPLILLYSRFAEFRPGRIVALVGQVAAQLPAARWLVVGKGLYGEHTQLADQLAEAGLSSTVHFAGWLPQEELPGVFAAAGVAVHPYDNTPINRAKCSVKLIDLLQAGLPVVADAVGQNTEYIEDGVSGLLTPPEDDAAMAASLVRLLQSPRLRESLGQAACQRVTRHFNWSLLAQTAEKAYR